ncbi:MAG TPA: hypothetical protein P5121_05925 [Caldilineaceae bacterium]|nr:hypothetical protein [Caldilineaceae bacterium]
MSKQSLPRFVPLQSAPMWNGCGRPTAIHDCVIVKHRARQVISAIRTLENQLRLYSWRVDAQGVAVCTGATDAQMTDVAQVSLVRAQKYISGCRTFQGQIQLRCWDVSNTGVLYASGPATALAAGYTWLQLLVLAPDRLLTIGLTTDGQWHLTTWSITEENVLLQMRTVTMPATTGAIAAALLDPVQISPATATPVAQTGPISFLTARQSDAQEVKWTHWHCSPDGGLTVYRETALALTAVIDLALTTVNGEPVTLIHYVDGRLQALYGWPSTDQEWGPETATDTLQQSLGSRLVTLSDEVRLFSLTHDLHQLTVAYITTMSTGAQNVCTPASIGAPSSPEVTTVQMHRWHSTAQQWVADGEGIIPIATATELTLCNQPLDGNAPFLTAICTAAGMLHLVTWSDTFQNQFN